MDCQNILDGIRRNLKDYIVDNKLKSLILGVSGGVDSALVAAIVKPVCDECKIPLIGAWIEIKGNKKEEKDRAIMVGNSFCNYFNVVDLTKQYECVEEEMNGSFTTNSFFYPPFQKETSIQIQRIHTETDFEKKVRLGNIKARLRMIYLYNVAQECKGCTLNTDNRTEHELGFWTIHGDDFDLDLILNLWKTEVYELTRYITSTLENENQKQALLACIDAIPTDGLGITNSDLEQFGCDTYEEVDEILKVVVGEEFNSVDDVVRIFNKYGEDKITKIRNRHRNSAFKRKLPINLTYKR